MFWNKRGQIKQWIAQLARENSAFRREAAEALGEIGDVYAVDALNTALDDPDWTVRREIVEALGKIGGPRTIEPLVTALRDQEWTVQKEAAKALGDLGSIQSIEPLIETLGDQEWTVRKEAAEALGKIGSAAIEPLLKALKNEKWEWAIRREVALALGKIGDTRSVGPLIQVLKDRQAEVIRWMVIWALGQIGDSRAIKPLIKSLGDMNSDVRENAALALDNIGWRPQSTVEKVSYFFAKKEWEKCRSVGLLNLKPLLMALQDDDWTVRRGTVQVLGTIGDARTIEPLVTLLHDPNWYDKKIVVESLKQIYVSIEVVLFRSASANILNPHTTLLNPDVADLTFPMSHLEKIVIYTGAYDFHLIERFITYAVSYIGQKHLKKSVEAHIYGDPDKLHPNLQNSLENLCRNIAVHG